MAEAFRNTPDTPNFDTYPAPGPVPVDRQLPKADPVGERLNGAAEQIGSTVGRAVRNVRRLPDSLSVLKDRFTVIAGRGQRVAGEKAREIKDAAGEQVERARQRADEVATEYPVHVILGAATVAFLLGVGLRVWRANRG